MQAFFTADRVCGNDEEKISLAISACKKRKGQASCIVLDTVKGQGVDFLQNGDNHSVKFNETVDSEADKAISELERQLAEGEISK